MKEDFLQTIWQLQLFNLPVLTTEGIPITVIKPGIRNRGDGPDFRQARMVMDKLEWNGSVEVHVQSGDWHRHGHQRDPAYDGVILHVVWEEDQPVFRRDGSRIPAIELKYRIPLQLLLNYRHLLTREEKIPCAGLLSGIPDIVKTSMLDTALAERLERRARQLFNRHIESGFDWYRTAAQNLARCLGMPGNEDPMESLVQKMPASWLQGRMPVAEDLEEFLIMLAGVEQNISFERIRKIELLLAQSGIEAIRIPWSKSGRRPAAFPRERIRLLAYCLPLLPEWIRTEQAVGFGGFIQEKGVEISKEMRRHLKINFEAPFRMARLIREESSIGVQHILDGLHSFRAENHQVSRLLSGAGMPMETAAQSQGGKELLDYYCRQKRCMQCRIGLALLEKPISAE